MSKGPKEFWRILRRFRDFENAAWSEFGVFPVKTYANPEKRAKKIANNMVDVYECRVQHVRVVDGVETILSEEVVEVNR